MINQILFKNYTKIFKQGILNLDPDIEINTRKLYIAFKKDRNIADIRIQQKNLKIWINLPYGELDDPKNLAKKCI